MADNSSITLRKKLMRTGLMDDVELFRAMYRKTGGRAITKEQAILKLVELGLQKSGQSEILK